MQRELNDAFLRALKPPAEGEVTIRDAGHDGLELRVTSKGAMTWAVRARKPDGTRVRVSMGRYPTVKLAAARKAATTALATVIAGKNPNEEKRKAKEAREAAAAELTVKQRVEGWLEAKAKGWSDTTYATVRGHMNRTVIPTIGKKALRSTSRADWVEMVEAKKTKHPGGAATLYRWIAAFLNDAEASGWIDLPLLPRKGAARLAPQGPARERALSDAEVIATWEAAGKLTARPCAFVRLLILTAARREEVAAITVEEIDLHTATWTIPKERTKNGVEMTIPLGPLAMEEIRAAIAAMKVKEGEPVGYLLGRFTSSPLSGFSRLKGELDAQLPGMPAWRLHDLRRSARTGMGRLGVPDNAAEAALNHVSGRSALVRTYDRYSYVQEARAALLLWQAHVASLVGQGGEVVPLRRSA